VQYGALFLVAGFGFQALSYVIRLGDQWWLAIVLLCLVVPGGLRIGTSLAERGLPRHIWYADLQPPDRIADGLVVYGVSTVIDLERVVARTVRDRRARDIESIGDEAVAFISGGLWTVKCPRCDQPTAATTPAWGKGICTSCAAQFDVQYPDGGTRASIEAELANRLDPAERRWEPRRSNADGG
jgi:hypothetical protein